MLRLWRKLREVRIIGRISFHIVERYVLINFKYFLRNHNKRFLRL